MNNQTSTQTGIIALSRAHPLQRFILETFAATGQSPSIEDIRTRFELASPDEAESQVAALERAGAIHREAGDTVITHAYPFSNNPTEHRVQLAGGPQVFAMCAIDALDMPFMLRRDARIQSACAECGDDVRIEIAHQEIIDHSPGSVVVWLAQRVAGCVAATDLCPDLNFFCSPGHLAAWRERTAGSGDELSVAEALARGRQAFEHVLAEA